MSPRYFEPESLANIPDIRKNRMAYGSKMQRLEYFTLEFNIKAMGCVKQHAFGYVLGL